MDNLFHLLDNRPMDLNEIMIFCRVAQAGSFTSASQILGLPKSTVSRKVQDLETRLGVTLLKRTTRKLHLTEAGQQLFHGSRVLLSDLEAITQLATAGQREPQGRVRMTAATDVGNAVLARLLPDLLRLHPKIILDLNLTDRIVDIIGEGFDIALRIGPLRDSSLLARKIGATTSHLYASPGYLKRSGPIRAPEDVEEHLRFRFSRITDEDSLTLRGPGHRSVRLRLGDHLAVDSFLVIREMVLRGQGIALLPAFLVHDDVQQRRLIPVLENWSGHSTPVHLVYSKQKFVPPAVSAVLSFLAERLPEFFRS